MASTGELRLSRRIDLRIFDTTKRRGVVSRASTRIGKRLVKKLQDLMVYSKRSGVLYRVSAGVGFRRSVQASAYGERPAPRTFNLVKSIKSRSTKERTVTVYIDLTKAPYAKYLQSVRLGRKILTVEDIEDFNANELLEEMERLHSGLWS